MLKLKGCVILVHSIGRTIIEEALEQPTSNVPLTELHIILVTIMWIIMGLDMKSVRPLSLFDTTVFKLSMYTIYGIPTK